MIGASLPSFLLSLTPTLLYRYPTYDIFIYIHLSHAVPLDTIYCYSMAPTRVKRLHATKKKRQRKHKVILEAVTREKKKLRSVVYIYMMCTNPIPRLLNLTSFFLAFL